MPQERSNNQTLSAADVSLPHALLPLSLLVMLFASSALAENASSLPERGFALAKLHCARCHIVDESNRFTGTSSTPSFKTMVSFLPDWKDRFDSFMSRNPHPAHIRLDVDDPRPENLPATIQELILTQDDIEAILAYVDQLAQTSATGASSD